MKIEFSYLPTRVVPILLLLLIVKNLENYSYKFLLGYTIYNDPKRLQTGRAEDEFLNIYLQEHHLITQSDILKIYVTNSRNLHKFVNFRQKHQYSQLCRGEYRRRTG